MKVLFLVPVIVSLGGSPHDPLPPQLREAIGQQSAARTSHIEWTVSWIGQQHDGTVERFVTRTAGDTIWQSNPGDENGYHYDRAVDVDGNAIPKEETRGTRNSLIFDGYGWYVSRAERPLTGDLRSLDPRSLDEFPAFYPFEITSGGMAPGWIGVSGNGSGLGLPSAYFLDGIEGAEVYSVTSDNMESIVAEFNGRRLEWDIDLARDRQPVRAAYYVGDRLDYHSRTELAQFDGRWLPKKMLFFEGDDPEPSHTIEVTHASFDEPWHMQEIRPEDIGVLFGTQLFKPDVPRPKWGSGLVRWDGVRLISGDEFMEMVWGYGVDPDPRITELMAELVARGTPNEHLEDWQKLEAWEKRVELSRNAFRKRYYEESGGAPWLVQGWKEIDEWDKYVEEFIKKHELDEGRAKRAKDLLKRAKQLRDYHQRKNREEAAKARSEGSEARAEHHEAREKEIVQRIFDTYLVRGLKLLVPKDKKEDKRDE